MIEALELKGKMQHNGKPYNKTSFRCLHDITPENNMADVNIMSINHGYNGFINFVFATQILIGCDKSVDSFLCVPVKQFVQVIEDMKNDNIVLINIGLHYYSVEVRRLTNMIRLLMAELNQFSSQGTNIIFRMTLPQHFGGFSKSGWYHEESKNKRQNESKDKSICAFIKNPARHGMDLLVRQEALKYGFSIFDDFDFFFLIFLQLGGICIEVVRSMIAHIIVLQWKL